MTRHAHCKKASVQSHFLLIGPLFVLIWRIAKYSDVPRRDHIYYRHHAPPRRLCRRRRVTVWIASSIRHLWLRAENCKRGSEGQTPGEGKQYPQ